MGANHARVFGGLPEADLVAVADTDVSRQALTGARSYTDVRTLITKEALDAVTIAVPTRAHLEVALACIDRGLPLLVEKPLGASLDECLRLRDAADAAGVPLMIGHIERFNPAVRELKRRLDAGEVGGVHELRACRIGPFAPRSRDVGVVHDLATHDIDIFRYVLSREVEQVQAKTERGIRTEFEDSLDGLLSFAGGATGTLKVNWLSDAKVRELMVVGDHGVIAVDYITQKLRFGKSAGATMSSMPVEREEPLRAELQAFLRVARREEPPPVTADDGIAAMRVVEALVEAARLGEPVQLAAGSATA
jgi:predicted dehydrogenase